MGTLTARLEVRLPPRTLQLLRQEARIRGMPVAQLVREAIELWLMQDRQARVQAAEALFQIEAPVANWPEMKQEVEEAHLKADLP